MFIYLMKRSNVLKHALHSNECAGLVNDKLRVVGGGGGGGGGWRVAAVTSLRRHHSIYVG